MPDYPPDERSNYRSEHHYRRRGETTGLALLHEAAIDVREMRTGTGTETAGAPGRAVPTMLKGTARAAERRGTIAVTVAARNPWRQIGLEAVVFRERDRRKSKHNENRDKKKRPKDKEKTRDKDERRSVLTGKRIKLKVRKDSRDLEMDANREDLLQFLNSTFE
ncbi:hypothetical protein V8E55_001260 [Tylopilus felleus]